MRTSNSLFDARTRDVMRDHSCGIIKREIERQRETCEKMLFFGDLRMKIYTRDESKSHLTCCNHHKAILRNQDAIGSIVPYVRRCRPDRPVRILHEGIRYSKYGGHE